MTDYKVVDIFGVHGKAVLGRYDIGTFLEDNGIKSFITVGRINRSPVQIKYKVLGDTSKFVNLFRLNVSTETGFACLGYNANSSAYIPIFSVVELFNKLFFKDFSSPVFTIDDLKYFMESFKLNYEDFNAIDYLRGMLSGLSSESGSVVFRYLLSQRDDKYLDKIIFNMGDDDVYKLIYSFYEEVLLHVDQFARVFMGNFILEPDRRSVDIPGSGMESSFLGGIRAGVPAEFLREVSSCGVGRNRRMDVLTNRIFNDKKKALALLSSWAYYDAYKDNDLKSVGSGKILCYNFLDLLRSIYREQDLFFSYDMLKDSKAFYKNLIKKLGLEKEIERLGEKEFLESVVGYAKVVGTMEMGGSYSRRVKNNQVNFSSVVSKSISNSGSTFLRVSKRILSKFS